MSRASPLERGGLGPALRWAGAGALVLGVHLGAGALLLGRSMLPEQPDAAVLGITIDLEPMTILHNETAPAAEPPPAPQAAEPSLADPASAELRVATAEVLPASARPPETPPPRPETQAAAEPPAPPPPAPLPEPPKARKAEEAVLARPPLPRLKPKPKPVAPPPKTPVDRAAEAAERRDTTERDVAQQERREARREAARQRATDRRASAAAAAPAREPAEAQPRASASAGEVASWRGALVAHLDRFKRSPPGGGSGTARVSFSVTASGGVSSVRLASSSGDPALDEAALMMVQRADPVPAPPSGMGARVSLSVPVHFSGP